MAAPADDTLIRAENVYKKYCRDIRRSMIYGLRDISADMINRRGAHAGRLRRDEFWALEGVSFAVNKGEVLGVIGANGSGKSTLLKLISGIFFPDSGSITTRGKVGGLIEVSAGFHPMLTGRENVYIKGAILGLGKREIDEAFDEIVEFSGLADFMNTPVKYYSSGMNMRLGFSIIVHSRPEILLVDEVLSVGDISFRARCFNKITDLINDSAVIFVSHNMIDITRICTDAMVLSHGKCEYFGNVMNAIECYYNGITVKQAPVVTGSGKAAISQIKLESASRGNPLPVQDQLNNLVISMTVNVDLDVPCFEVVVTLTNLEQQNVLSANSHLDKIHIDNFPSGREITVNMGQACLNPGIYAITISLHRQNRGEILVKYGNCIMFRVKGSRLGYALLQQPAQWELAGILVSK